MQFLFETDQGLRMLDTASCCPFVVSIGQNVTQDVEQTNRHRDVTREVLSSLQVAGRELMKRRICMSAQQTHRRQQPYGRLIKSDIALQFRTSSSPSMGHLF